MVCELCRDDLLTILKEHVADKELLSPPFGIQKVAFGVEFESFERFSEPRGTYLSPPTSIC